MDPMGLYLAKSRLAQPSPIENDYRSFSQKRPNGRLFCTGRLFERTQNKPPWAFIKREKHFSDGGGRLLRGKIASPGQWAFM